MSQPRINFNREIYPSLTIGKSPDGCLPNDLRAMACWFFYVRAETTRQLVGESTEDQIILEGELWMDGRYEQLALTTALIYGLESPSEFAKFWPEVTKQALALGYPAPSHKYTNIIRGRLIV